jgi:hypothetical protein
MSQLIQSLKDALQIGVYRGLYIEKVVGGVKCLGKIVTTKEQLDELINSKMIEWGKTIAK